LKTRDMPPENLEGKEEWVPTLQITDGREKGRR